MSGDVHVRFCERLGVRFPRATRLVILLHPRTDPQVILAQVRGMLGRLGLELHPEKTALIAFGKPEPRQGSGAGNGCCSSH